jgi:hypothetical protein
LGRLLEPVTGGRMLHRRTGVRRVAKQVSDVKLPTTVKGSLPEIHPPKAVKSGLAAAGGLIGLTAGSAAVSAARRRSEGSRAPS